MTDDTSSTVAAGHSQPVASRGDNGHAAGDAAADAERGDGWLDRLLAVFGVKQPETLRENLVSALADERHGDTFFSPEERRLLSNILRLRDLKISDVMVPRADIDAVDENVPLYELLRLFRTAGHSRLPVFRDTLDDPVGFVHIKDVTIHIAEKASAAAGEAEGLDFAAVDLGTTLKDIDIVRPVLFVPPSMPAVDLMVRMRAARVQLALVIDEYGGTDGLVSLEDLVETVVGDIEDEYDTDEDAMLTQAGDSAWIADGRLPLEEFEEETGISLDAGDLTEYVDTVGGLVFAMLGRVPARGELISSEHLPGFEFEGLDADPRRIRRLKIYRRERAEGALFEQQRVEARERAARAV
jgi:CBS domain containing-hemolysin-like protein